MTAVQGEAANTTCRDCGTDMGGLYGDYGDHDRDGLYVKLGNRYCRPCIARRAATPMPPITALHLTCHDCGAPIPSGYVRCGACAWKPGTPSIPYGPTPTGPQCGHCGDPLQGPALTRYCEGRHTEAKQEDRS